ncbi:Multiple inositol polyphosphate phosphatase [Ceraceosorus bombacis]|uniref:Multiple inositol polyphosphate phosphatase n=1 Tax=Ceraceosorus bombacis TaxID=401625 RepID=A0A0P1BQ80_9BASI|nr:Multiple inositol polyphosphate phosphatase [Ceraceosorus bombacis]
MPRHYTDNVDDEAGEDEGLVLHRMATDPQGRSVVHTIPSGEEGAEPYADTPTRFARPHGGRATDALLDELNAEEENIALPRRDAPELDKTGRPAWLLDTLSAARHNSRFRLAIALVLAGLLVFTFSFAFSPVGDAAGKVYGWGADRWRGKHRPWDWNPDHNDFPGVTKPGVPANLANDHPDGTPTRGALPIQTSIPGSDKSFQAFEHMGPLSPYFASPGFGVDNIKHRTLSDGCKVEAVHMLHRHGSRYPTSGSPTELIPRLLATSGISFSGPLSFLNTYKYKLGAELLVPLGRAQLYESGVKAAIEYGSLLSSDASSGKQLARAGSQHRIVESGVNWLAGAWGAGWRDKANLEIQIEAPRFNTTLAPNFACENASRKPTAAEPGAAVAVAWEDKYLEDALRRLSPYVKGGALTTRLLFAFQQACSYDTVAFGYSRFCALFTTQEWLDYEYAWDLVFYGSYGPGSPVGRAQGVGWVNELVSRLEGRPWDASTQTSENSTLNTDPLLFPLHKKFYVDFTHDSVIANVLAALELPDFAQDLPKDKREPGRKYKSSTLVPFAARLVFEDRDRNVRAGWGNCTRGDL